MSPSSSVSPSSSRSPSASTSASPSPSGGLVEVPCDLTLADLRERVYERLDEDPDDPIYYTVAECNHALNVAQRLWALITLCIERNVTFTESTAFLTISTQLSDFIAPLRITSANGRVKPATLHELAARDSKWRTRTGTPKRYAQNGFDLIAFLPHASVSLTLTYAAEPAPLTSDLQVPEIPGEQQIHLPDFAIWWLRQKEGGQEAQNAGVYFKRFLEHADKYSKFVRSRSRGPIYDTMPFDLTHFDRGRLDMKLAAQKAIMLKQKEQQGLPTDRSSV